MAIRKNNVLGQTSGKLGNTVTRIRNGKEVVYALPDKVKISNSKHAKSARNKFALTVGFAKFINSIPALSGIWSYAKIPGTNSFQKLIKHNSKFTNENSLTVNNIITPSGFDLSIEKFSFAGNILHLLIKPAAAILPVLLSSKVHFHSVLYSYQPKLKNDKSFMFSHLFGKIESLMPDTATEVRLSLNLSQQNLIRNYKQSIIYFTIVVYPDDAKSPLWSNTAARQL